MKSQISSTPVRTEKEMQTAIEELRRELRRVTEKVTELEGRIPVPPAT